MLKGLSFASVPLASGFYAFLLMGNVSTAASPPLTTLPISSPNTGMQPFMSGAAISDGLACSGSSIITDSTSSQVTVLRTWNSGCAKIISVAGTENIAVANASQTIHVLTGTPPNGTLLTCANIQTAAPTASVAGIGNNPFSAVDLSTLLKTPWRRVGASRPEFISGPEFVHCDYKATASNGSLVIFYVDLWKSGKMRVRVGVENGWFDQNLGTLSYTATVTVGGVQIFNGAIRAYPHTRWSQVGWIGGNPQVYVHQSPADIVAAKLAPNYYTMGTPPTTAALNALVPTCKPMANAGLTTDMGETGPQPQIGLFPLWDADFITSGDKRAYNSVLANADCLNSYAIVWREHADGDIPMLPSFVGDQMCGCFNLQEGTLNWDLFHHPSGGIVAWMLTADIYYLETAELQGTLVWYTTQNGYATPPTFNGSHLFGGSPRGWAWALRTIAQIDAVIPSSEPMLAEYQKLLGDNATFWNSTAGNYAPLGIFYTRVQGRQSNYFEQMWEQDFGMFSMGYAIEAQALPSGTDANNLLSLALFHAKSVVGRLGTQSDGGFCFTQGGYNATQAGSDNIVPPLSDPSVPQALAHLQPDWRTAFTKSVADRPEGTVYRGYPCGTSLISSGGVGLVGDCTASGWPSLISAAAYAADLGAPGAAMGWTRLTTSDDWISDYLPCVHGGTGFGLRDSPAWTIKPR